MSIPEEEKEKLTREDDSKYTEDEVEFADGIGTELEDELGETDEDFEEDE